MRKDIGKIIKELITRAQFNGGVGIFILGIWAIVTKRTWAPGLLEGENVRYAGMVPTIIGLFMIITEIKRALKINN